MILDHSRLAPLARRCTGQADQAKDRPAGGLEAKGAVEGGGPGGEDVIDDQHRSAPSPFARGLSAEGALLVGQSQPAMETVLHQDRVGALQQRGPGQSQLPGQAAADLWWYRIAAFFPAGDGHQQRSGAQLGWRFSSSSTSRSAPP